MFLAPVFGWAQTTDFSGIWYIASNGSSTSPSSYAYNFATPENNYYLRPAADPQQTNNIDAYWYHIGDPASNDPEKPFLTTNKTGHVDLALWIVVKTGDYYLIKHAVTGKYVKCEPCITGTLGENDNSRRKTMHLEACSGTPTDDDFKFIINYSGEEIYIVPKIVEDAGKSYKYWNIADKNQPHNNGQGNSPYYGGLIGLYTTLNNGSLDVNSKWRFEDARPEPIISYNYPMVSITIPTSLTFPSLASLKYTTDGSDPTTSATALEYTGPFELTSECTIKAYGISSEGFNSKTAIYNLEKVATPALTVTSNRIYIICAIPGVSIYYTTDGTEPNPNYSSHLYNNTPLTCSGATIKAIALKSTLLPSALFEGSATLACDPPVITRTDATHFSITEGFPSPDAAVTLYYTTGSGDPDTEHTGTPVAFSGTVTVKAQATATGFDPSTIVETSFNSNGLPGGGTSADPYVINDDISFSYFLSHPSNGYYQLTKDVTAPGSMSSIATFSGTLEGVADAKGNFPVISGLTKPLFTTATGATLCNIMLDEVNISQSGKVGSIACTANGATRIYNVGILGGTVKSTGTSSAQNSTDCCGGLVGSLDGTARVVNCFSYANITGGSHVGGLVGYNNGTTTSASINTMVMNCMFYGDIIDGATVSPIYGGNKISNLSNQNGLNTFNYYAYDSLKTKEIDFYNCALAVEAKYLNRFEFYRLLLNSNKELAAYYATGDVANANDMAKWVLETADRSIANPKPYPILKARGFFYPSIVNPDFQDAPDSTAVGPNQGGKLRKTLSVTISESNTTTGGQTKPSGASLSTTSLTLTRTDKDFDRFNFNYDKVQLPYYNDVGTGNYTENRVVTGWKITAMEGGTEGTYTAADEWGGYNFADRKCTKKDLYSVSGRVFSQGAYFDVPYGVISITIEPYWGKAAYLADEYYDKVSKTGYAQSYVTEVGKQVESSTTFNNQSVYTTVNAALSNISSPGSTVYDNAVVLWGNFHQANIKNTAPFTGTTPFTIMSVDLDNDNEPDNSLIYHDNDRSPVCGIRFDFLNVPGTAQVQKPDNADTILNASVFNPKSWFEITNTSSIYFSQFEYENINKTGIAPVILLGGVCDQFVSTKLGSSSTGGLVKTTSYLHVGGNAWFHAFGNGTHSDGSGPTTHIPISVTGGEYEGFYLTGTYNSDATMLTDNAECYISGGHFVEAAGASLEQIGGDVRWQIYDADIDHFYGGGTNDATPILGDIRTDIFNSRVGVYCGGPKFGNMASGKKVTSNAKGCTFDRFFGAGYGGTALSRKKYRDEKKGVYNWSNYQKLFYTNNSGDRGKYYDGTTPAYSAHPAYGNKGPGVAVDFDYEFFVWTTGVTGARFFVKFATFSTAQCNDVKSTLTHCTVNGDFFGGGSLGKVIGTATSVLDSCTVKGNVYGAGYSASLESIEVRNAGFASDGNGGYKFPNFNSSSGMFEPGTFSETTTFQWEEGTFPTNGTLDPNFANNKVTTEVDLDDLGSVQQVDLTITGNSAIGTPGAPDKGHVFGGGDESMVSGNTLVKILGHIKVYGNIYGGGNQGEVQGNTKVIMNGKIN